MAKTSIEGALPQVMPIHRNQRASRGHGRWNTPGPRKTSLARGSARLLRAAAEPARSVASHPPVARDDAGAGLVPSLSLPPGKTFLAGAARRSAPPRARARHSATHAGRQRKEWHSAQKVLSTPPLPWLSCAAVRVCV